MIIFTTTKTTLPIHAKIWHTCFFSFFENLPFWALGTHISLKLQGSLGKSKMALSCWNLAHL